MSARKRILVTGGAGYIGSHTIVELMKNDEFEVISIDNYSNSEERTYDRIASITGKKPLFYNIDLTDAAALESVFTKEKNLDGVIHFAAYKSVPESVAEPLVYYRNNVLSLTNLLSCCIGYKVDHVIFSSSCSVYGNIDKLPVNERTPLQPAESPYASTKVMGETILRDVTAGSPRLRGLSLRYFNPVGAHESGRLGELPRNRPNNLFPIITQTAIGKQSEMTVFGNDYPTRDGSCIRDYVHVSDIAFAHVLGLKKLFAGALSGQYNVINVGSGKGVTVLEALHAFEKFTGNKVNYRVGERRAGDVSAIYSDCTLAAELLGWTPQRDLQTMAESAWKWELNLKAGL